MDIKSLMKEHKIALYVEFDTKSQKYTLFKNDEAELYSYELFNQLILYGDYSYLESIKDEELLPRGFAQGNTQCCIFPTESGNVVCPFYESELNVYEKYYQSQKYVKIFQQIIK